MSKNHEPNAREKVEVDALMATYPDGLRRKSAELERVIRLALLLGVRRGYKMAGDDLAALARSRRPG